MPIVSQFTFGPCEPAGGYASPRYALHPMMCDPRLAGVPLFVCVEPDLTPLTVAFA